MFINIQVRGLRTTRRRQGEELEDPIFEADDGDGETPEVAAHFDLNRKILDVNREIQLETRNEGGVDSPSVKVGQAAAGQFMDPSGGGNEGSSEEQTGSRQQRNRTALYERQQLLGLAKDNPKSFLREFYTRGCGPQPFELSGVIRLRGLHVRYRLRAQRGLVAGRITLHATEGLPQTSSKNLSARRRLQDAPTLVLEGEGILQPDGSVADLSLSADLQHLPVLNAKRLKPAQALAAVLMRTPMPPKMVLQRALRRQYEQRPLLPFLSLMELLHRLPHLELGMASHFHNEAGIADSSSRLAMTLDELLEQDHSWQDEEKLAPTLYRLLWNEAGRVQLEQQDSVADNRAALSSDLTRVLVFAKAALVALERVD